MNRLTIFFSLIAVLVIFAGYTKAQESTTTLSESDINSIIENFIRENPEVLVETLEQYQVDQQQQAEAKASEKLSAHEDYLLNGDLPRVGNPDGDIKIVEFFDYNCGYCKRAFEDLRILLEADPNVEITFVEMPILGEGSLEAARWSMAAAKQNEDKYFDYHSAIISFSGNKNETSMLTLAETAGLDTAALKEAANNPEIVDAIEKNVNIAREIGIRGTPGFIINGEIYRGYLGYDGLKAVIDEIRLSNKSAPAAKTEGSIEIPETDNTNG